MSATPGPRLTLVPAPAPADPAAKLTLDGAFRAYAAYVAAIGARILGRDDEVDDLVQDVFVEAARGLARLHDPGAVKGWLATVAVRAATRRLRARGLRRLLGLDDPFVGAAAAWPGVDPERGALLARVYRLLDEVPARQRIAWILRVVEGEELHAVASMSGCSLATAKRWVGAVKAHIERKTSDGG